MLKNLKIRLLSTATVAAISLGFIAVPAGSVDAAGGVTINAKNFPDPYFRLYLTKNWDIDGNGKLSASDMKEIQHLDFSYSSGSGDGSGYITNLKGIELFTELKTLDCNDNTIKSIDVSKNKKLEKLTCTKVQLEKLNVKGCTNLKEIYCGNNKLKTLDVSSNKKLAILHCYENQLEKLNIKGCKSLWWLYCSNNKLERIDVSTNTELSTFDCSFNKLTSLDVSKCTSMDTLCCHNNLITKLDISSIKEQRNEHWGFVNNNKVKELVLSAGSCLKINENCGSMFGLQNNVKTTWKISNKSIIDFVTFYDMEIGGEETNLVAKKPGIATVTMTDPSGKSVKVTITVAYKDVKNKSNFWYEPTYYLSAKDIVKGYKNQTLFKPSNKCTRAQMVAFLYRLAGEPKVDTSKCKFSDVKKSDYFYKAVIWAVNKGITTGYKDGLFKPQNVCTRAQTVTFLWRMAGSPNPKSTKNKFKDVKSKDYFYKAVLWASEKGIVAGYKDGTFKPKGKCLRRQMVTFLAKFDKNIYSKKSGGTTKPTIKVTDCYKKTSTITGDQYTCVIPKITISNVNVDKVNSTILQDCSGAKRSFDSAKSDSNEFQYISYEYYKGDGYISLCVVEWNVSNGEDCIEYYNAIRVYNIDSKDGHLMSRSEFLTKLGITTQFFDRAVAQKLGIGYDSPSTMKTPQPYQDPKGNIRFAVEVVTDGYSDWFSDTI